MASSQSVSLSQESPFRRETKALLGESCCSQRPEAFPFHLPPHIPRGNATSRVPLNPSHLRESQLPPGTSPLRLLTSTWLLPPVNKSARRWSSVDHSGAKQRTWFKVIARPFLFLALPRLETKGAIAGKPRANSRCSISAHCHCYWLSFTNLVLGNPNF